MMPVVEPSAQALPRDRIVRVMTWNIANCTKTAGHSATRGCFDEDSARSSASWLRSRLSLLAVVASRS